MERSSSKAQCITCGKARSAVRCEGCLQIFCRHHLTDHCQELSLQLDKIEVHRDLFRQTLTEQTIDPQKHPLIKEIDQWENDSIRTIQQTAEECRKVLLQHTTEHINQIEINLIKLTDQIRQSRQENDFDETDLKDFNQKLTQLAKELDERSNVSIKQHSAKLISKISVDLSKEQFIFSPTIDINTKWRQNEITVAGGNGEGSQSNQLSYPESIYVDDDNQCIYIADYNNDRIVKWNYDAKTGEVVADENGEGDQTDQLSGPKAVIVDRRNDSLIVCDSGNDRLVRWSRRNGTNWQTVISDIEYRDLAIDDNGNLYVSDCVNDEVRRWEIGETEGTIVAGGNGEGDQLNQLDCPSCICIDQDHSIYVSDENNHRVMKWMKGAKEGIVVAGGQGDGNSLTQLSQPQGVIVDQLGHVYVADCGNHRIMKWSKGSTEGSVVGGGNGQGHESNQFDCPTGLSFDRQSNLYVVDHNNHRVQKFQVDSN